QHAIWRARSGYAAGYATATMARSRAKPPATLPHSANFATGWSMAQPRPVWIGSYSNPRVWAIRVPLLSFAERRRAQPRRVGMQGNDGWPARLMAAMKKPGSGGQPIRAGRHPARQDADAQSCDAGAGIDRAEA